MQANLKATAVKHMANEAAVALAAYHVKNPGMRMPQAVRVKGILAFATTVPSTANVTLDLEDFLALTQLP